ncbi:Thiostrepton precursor [Actinoalloteichus hoggarensis]|uniref:Thiostrepton n=2 Tax=Actinoalloteichus hoggarensis TaxID=1470176 RepID=A0A221W4A4_9PSEU|nr:Thiostrepton precursor [Actinoalloteichus hoggarensis]
MNANSVASVDVGIEGLTGLDVDTLEIGDYLDETVLDTTDLTETMTSSSSCTTCICTCSCSS